MLFHSGILFFVLPLLFHIVRIFAEPRQELFSFAHCFPLPRIEHICVVCEQEKFWFVWFPLLPCASPFRKCCQLPVHIYYPEDLLQVSVEKKREQKRVPMLLWLHFPGGKMRQSDLKCLYHVQLPLLKKFDWLHCW